MIYVYVKIDNVNDLILKEIVLVVDIYILYFYLRFVVDCWKGKG